MVKNQNLPIVRSLTNSKTTFLICSNHMLTTHTSMHPWKDTGPLPHLISPPSRSELSANKRVNIKRSSGCHNDAAAAVLLLSAANWIVYFLAADVYTRQEGPTSKTLWSQKDCWPHPKKTWPHHTSNLELGLKMTSELHTSTPQISAAWQS